MIAKAALILIVALGSLHVSQAQNVLWHRQANSTTGSNGTAVELDNCEVSGPQFTCVVPTDFVYAPGTDTEVIFSVTCDLNAAIGPDIEQSSGCVCDAVVNDFMNGTLTTVRSCACSPCTNNTMVEFSLDCSAEMNPFIREGCVAIDCLGQCSGATMAGNMTPGTPATTAPTTSGATAAPGATTAPTPAGATTPPVGAGAGDTNTSAPTASGNIFNDTSPAGMPSANDTAPAMPSNETTAPPTSKPTFAPRSDCFVRGQAGYGFTVTGNSVLCEGSDACAGGLVANCETVTCKERDCTSANIVNATTVICEGESACRLANIGEPNNPVDTVHCMGKDWACYQAKIYAKTTVICEDNSGECLVNENGICGFANLSTPCLQCIGTNHGCGAAGSCTLNGDDCPEYRYGGETCEAACPEGDSCKMNDTIHECGDAESGASIGSYGLLVGWISLLVSLMM